MSSRILTIISVALLAGCATAASSITKPCSETPGAAGCDVHHINTRGWEDSPYLTPDGKQLYFMYNPYNFFEMFFGGKILKLGPDRSEYSTKDPSDAWSPSNTYVSRVLPNGKWSVPVRVAWDRATGSCCAMGNKQGTVFYFQMGVPGNEGNRDIVFMFQKHDGSWGGPVYFDSNINSGATEDNPHMTADGRTLYWTSDRKDGKGGKDIWMSRMLANKQWAPATNLGSHINTDKNEDQWWISANGKTAYFNRETTIMMTAFDGNEWSEAKPVQFETSVMAAEASLTADGKTMVLAVVDMQRHDVVISVSRLKPNGVWATPVPVD